MKRFLAASIVLLSMTVALAWAACKPHSFGDASSLPGFSYGHVTLAATDAGMVPGQSLSPRHVLMVSNLSNAVVYCGWDNAVTGTTGFPIGADGGTVTLPIGFDGTRGQMWCYATAGQTAPGDLHYVELY